jgi:8-amino-7-oxononanoate synthase
MLDFTSALYLGMRHQSHALRPWKSFTGGVPAALRESRPGITVARSMADLQGSEDAVLAPSTLHLFWDLFGLIGHDDTIIYMDEGVYPIARWGVERAAAKGAVVRGFRHYNTDSLTEIVRTTSHRRKRPLIVSDGFCPSCGRPVPLSDYLSIAEAFGGYLLLDDTQALGILGHSPSRNNPYGIGGGGILRWSNVIHNPRLLVVSSMAKAFGAPVAVLSGSKAMVSHFRERSKIRVHCSPPSNAIIHAAEHALALNKNFGDRMRQNLLRLVRRFRHLMARAGFLPKGGVFPVQTLSRSESLDPVVLHERLLSHGIQTVLHQGDASKRALISLLMNARHGLPDIDYLVNALIEMTRVNKLEVSYEIRT